MIEVITNGAIIKSVASALGTAMTGLRVQAYDEITETIPDLPLIQVYADAANTDAFGENGRGSFDGTIRRTDLVIKVDGFARVRSNLGEDLKAQMELIDALDTLISRQLEKPFFGHHAIQDFKWRWERATFEHGDAKTHYAGCAFYIDVWIW